MSYDASLFNVDPYYDDFSEDKKFLRMMFRPGYAVQAREVTQLQTILQNQIERFGNHVFEDGSIVVDGQVNENYAKFARISAISAGLTNSDLLGVDFLSTDTTMGRIVHIESPISSTIDPYNIVFFEYTKGGSPIVGGSVITGTANNGVAFALTITGSGSVPAVGDATVVSVNQGVRFIEGFFVMNEEQKIGACSLSGPTGSQIRVFESPTCRVGFDVQKSFVTADDDETLNDPAFGYYNYAAPGSDRFKINLTLSRYNYDPSNTSSTDNFSRQGFVEFLRLIDGNIIKKELYPEYAVLEETLARRTYDESGNYTVSPFELHVVSGSQPDRIKYTLEPGKAYVFGYEFETQSNTSLETDRARTTRLQSNTSVASGFGPYLKTTLAGGGGTSQGVGLNLNDEPVVYLSDSKTTFTNIGTARLRHLNYSAPIWNAYLYDFSFTGSYSLTSVQAIHLAGATSNGNHLLAVTGGTASLYGERQNMIYPVPVGSAVKEFTDADYAVHRAFPSVSFSSTGFAQVNLGSYITFNSGQSYFPNYSNASFPSADFTIIGLSGQSYTGNVSRDTNTSIINISVTGATSFTAMVVSSVEMDFDASNGYIRRTKSLVEETIQVTGTTAQFIEDPGLTSRQFFYLNGLVDVLSIVAITGQYGGTTADVSSYLTLDTGQRDDLYDWSRMYLNAGVAAGSVTGPFDVTLTRYAHSGDFGPFTVESYPTYNTIPTYTSKTTGRKYKLHDVLDFRPTRNITGMSGHCPPTATIANDNSFAYTHYLSRTDKVVATRNRSFEVISGVPALNPVMPPDDPNKMTMYAVTLNPYTFTPDDSSVRFVENKRYTMRDIGDIERRVESVEKFATLTILEQEARNVSIKDENDLEIPKKGILVDQFNGHSIADVQDNKYAASIDFVKGELRPSFSNTVLSLEVNGTPVGVTATTDGIVMLSPSSYSAEIIQPLTTTTAIVNPSGIISHMGTLKLTPSVDNWYDETNSPTVRVNVQGENDAWALMTDPFGTEWRDWETNWYGTSVSDNSIKLTNTEENRSIFITPTGIDFGTIRAGSSPEQISRTFGDLRVKNDIVPYMQATTITIDAKGLKPNTQVDVYFDGISTSSESYLKRSSDNALVDIADITTNSKGELTGLYIDIPAGVFLTGKKTVRISDSASVTNATTAADQIFVALGSFGSQEDAILSTRIPTTVRESVRSEKVVSNPFFRKIQRSEQVRRIGSSDPMAQTFYVDPEKYPSGMFVAKVSVFINADDETNQEIPITVQLRPTINSYPHLSKVLPFASATKYVSDVTDGTATEFTFTTPVYLLPGQEYALCVLTNSQNITVDTAVMGDPLTGETGSNPLRATKQPYIRKFFRSQSGGTLTSTEKESLRFHMHSCVFPVGVSYATLRTKTTSEYGTSVSVHSYYLHASYLSPSSTTIGFKENGILSTANYVDVTPDLTIDLTTARGPFNPVTTNISNNQVSMSTTNRFVTPVFDLTRSATLLVQNIVNNNTSTINGEALPTNDTISTANKASARYITKRVFLESGMEATNLKVILSLCNFKPSGSSNTVEVYARLLPKNADTSFDNLPYTKLTEETTIPSSTNSNDFNDIAFSFPTDRDDFRAFAVKIVMLSSNSAYVSRIKNMRIIAT